MNYRKGDIVSCDGRAWKIFSIPMEWYAILEPLNDKDAPYRMEYTDKLTLSKHRPTRRELRQQIATLEGANKTLEIAIQASIKGNADLRSKNTELQSDIIDRDRLIAEAREIIEPLTKESEELQKQLADARQAVAIVEALEKLEYGAINHSSGCWSVTNGSIIQTQIAYPTLLQALTAAGLLTETDAQTPGRGEG